MAAEARANGQAAYDNADYHGAIRHFSEAIALDPGAPALYSSPSASYAALRQWSDALSDAKKAVLLDPQRPRGHQCMGVACLGLGRLNAAIQSFKQGLLLDPNDERLKSLLEEAEAEARKITELPKAAPFGSVFEMPYMWAKLCADSTTRAFTEQADFADMVGEIQKDVAKIDNYSTDMRLLPALGVLLDVKVRAPPTEEPGKAEEVKPPTSEEKEDVAYGYGYGYGYGYNMPIGLDDDPYEQTWSSTVEKLLPRDGSGDAQDPTSDTRGSKESALGDASDRATDPEP